MHVTTVSSVSFDSSVKESSNTSETMVSVMNHYNCSTFDLSVLAGNR